MNTLNQTDLMRGLICEAVQILRDQIIRIMF